MNRDDAAGGGVGNGVAPPDERDLLLRHRRGDADAFARLLARYRAPVYSYLVRCGVSDVDRDDVFQEVFIKVHRAAAQYEAHRPLHPWLFTIVANTVRTYHRRRRVRELVFTVAAKPDPPSAALEGDALSLANETAGWLQEEIRKLSQVEREVLILTCLENLRQDEVARVLDLQVNTVKTHLRRARIRLVEKLARRNASKLGGSSS